jgi:hypothetical protein
MCRKIHRNKILKRKQTSWKRKCTFGHGHLDIYPVSEQKQDQLKLIINTAAETIPAAEMPAVFPPNSAICRSHFIHNVSVTPRNPN